MAFEKLLVVVVVQRVVGGQVQLHALESQPVIATDPSHREIKRMRSRWEGSGPPD